MERLHDLLRDEETSIKNEVPVLKIRMNGSNVEVPGKNSCKVESYEDVERLIAKSQRRKAVAATQMNQKSSRGHTVMTLELVKNGKPLSTVYLVDLAGSERLGRTGATGQAAKEGAQINKCAPQYVARV